MGQTLLDTVLPPDEELLLVLEPEDVLELEELVLAPEELELVLEDVLPEVEELELEELLPASVQTGLIRLLPELWLP